MILDRLKAATAGEHAAVERTVEQLGYLRSVGDYRRLLERFWGFYAPIERQLAARPDWAHHGVDIGRRMKAPALARDLGTLGHSTATLGALPLCADLPPAGELAYAIGCLYVLEGATLGGQLIARQVRDAHGLSPERGCSFFASYAGDVGAMWRAFRDLAVAAAADAPAEQAMLGGAHATFQAFRHWLVRGATQ